MPGKQQATYLEETRQGRKIIAKRTKAEKAWSQLPVTVENLPLWASFLLIMSNMAAAAEHVNTQTNQPNAAHNQTFNALTPATTNETIADTNQALQASLFQTLQEFGKQPLQPDMLAAIKQINTYITDSKAQAWVHKFAKENKKTIEGLNALREAIGTGQFDLAQTLIELGITVDLIIPGQPTPLFVLTNLAQHEEYKPFKKQIKQLFHKIANLESALTPHPILPDILQEKSFLAKLYYQHSQAHFTKHFQEIHQDEITHFRNSIARIRPERVEVPVDAYYSEVMLEGRVYYVRYNPDTIPLINSQTTILTLSPVLKNLMDLLTKPAVNIEKITNNLSLVGSGENLIHGESILFAIRHAEVLALLKPNIQNFSPIGHLGDTPLARAVHSAALVAYEISARHHDLRVNVEKKHQEKLLSSDVGLLKCHWQEGHPGENANRHGSKSMLDVSLQYKDERDRIFSLIEFYLENGASLNEKNALGEPLIFDLLQTMDDTYHPFIKKYAVNLAVTNRRGQTPLNFYLKACADKPFALTLADMSPKSTIDKPDEDNVRPLDHALRAGQEPLCKRLIARGANLEANQDLIRAIEDGNDENKKAILANLRKASESTTLRQSIRRGEFYISLVTTMVLLVTFIYIWLAKNKQLKKPTQENAQEKNYLPENQEELAFQEIAAKIKKNGEELIRNVEKVAALIGEDVFNKNFKEIIMQIRQNEKYRSKKYASFKLRVDNLESKVLEVISLFNQQNEKMATISAEYNKKSKNSQCYRLMNAYNDDLNDGIKQVKEILKKLNGKKTALSECIMDFKRFESEESLVQSVTVKTNNENIGVQNLEQPVRSSVMNIDKIKPSIQYKKNNKENPHQQARQKKLQEKALQEIQRKEMEEKRLRERQQRQAATLAAEQQERQKNEEQAKRAQEQAQKAKELKERIAQQAEIASFLLRREPHIKMELKNLNQIKEYIDNIKGLMNIKFIKEKFHDLGEQKTAVSKRMQFYALLYGLIRTAECLNKLQKTIPFSTMRISFYDYYIRNNLMHRAFYLKQNPEKNLLSYSYVLVHLTYPALNALINNTLQQAVNEEVFAGLMVKNLYGSAIKAAEEDAVVILENLKSYLADMEILAKKINGMDEIGKIEKFTISNDMQYAAKGLLLLIAQRLRDLNHYAERIYQDLYNSLSKNGQFFLREILKLRNEIGHSNSEAGWEDDAMNTLYFYEEILPSSLKSHCLQINTHLAPVFDFTIATQPQKKYGLFAVSPKEVKESKLEPAQDSSKEEKLELPETSSPDENQEEQYLFEKYGYG